MQLIKSRKTKQQKWYLWRLYRPWVALVFLCYIALFGIMTFGFLTHKFHISPLVIVAWNCITVASCGLLRYKYSRAVKRRSVSPIPSDIPFFIEMWREPTDLESKDRIEWALTKLLVEAESADFALLNSSHRRFLNQMLLKPKTSDTDLVRAILTAWERAGDKHAISFVEKLALGQASAASFPDIQQQAQNCLLVLQERAVQEQNTETLLRASAPIIPPAELLRPAYDTPSSPEAKAQMLRASMTQDDTPPQ